jgi:nitroreductase
MDTLLAHLLEAASRAPSAHNTQPWRLRWQENELQVLVAEQRMLRVADPGALNTLHALGAMLENLLLTLGQLGFEGEYSVVEHWDLTQPVIMLRWHARPGFKPDPRLYRMIPIRRTSRVAYSPELILPRILEEIIAAAACPAKLYLLTDPAAIDEIRSLAAASGAEALQNQSYAAELYRWMRFSRRDPGWYRDGLNAECMGWNRLQSALVQKLLVPWIVSRLSKFRWSKWIYSDVEEQAPLAPALCLLATRDSTLAGHINAGRDLQRVWLTAAVHSLVTHPVSAAVDDPQSRNRVFKLFGVCPGEVHVNLFRLGKSSKTARSARLPADELLEPYA